MELKTLIIGIILLVGIFFVASEYGAIDELNVAASADSSSLVYQPHYPTSKTCVFPVAYIEDAENPDDPFVLNPTSITIKHTSYRSGNSIITKQDASPIIPLDTRYYRFRYASNVFSGAIVKCSDGSYVRTGANGGPWFTYGGSWSYDTFSIPMEEHVSSHLTGIEHLYLKWSQTSTRKYIYYKDPYPEGITYSSTTHSSFIESSVEPCPSDIDLITISTASGIAYKCDAYCRAYVSVCDGDVLQTCNPEGTAIDKEVCDYGCSNGACIQPDVVFGMNLQTADSYIYGEDVTAQVSVISADKPHGGALINGRIIKDGGIIAETSGYTDVNGVFNLMFPRVEGVGTLQLQVSTTHLGELHTKTNDIYFTGETVIFVPTTYSYIQYTTDEIKFNVHVKDAMGRYITPTTGELTVISSITNSDILSSTSKYLGDGNYEITSIVSGSGTYNGKVNMLYQGVNFESTGISIDVRDVVLEVGVGDFTPSAIIGDTETLQFSVVSSIGGYVDPDAVEIIVSYPTGYVTDTLSLMDMTGVSEGMYEFDYTFTEVEKYSFDIYVDKEEHVRGHAKATVAVTGVADDEDVSLLALFISNVKMVFIALVIIGSLFLIYKKMRR